MSAHIGRRVRRVEDPRLVTGRGRYAADVKLERLCHLAVRRSPFPNARILSIDSEAARGVPGVLAVWTADDLPELEDGLNDFRQAGIKGPGRAILARGEAHYVGDAIAVVVAEDPYQAQDAVEAIFADLEPLPAVGDLESALADGAPRAHRELSSNVCGHLTYEFGDIDQAFGEDAVAVRERLTTARICGAAMETRTVTASWDGSAQLLTVWTSTQGVFSVRDQIARLLGLEKDQVVVLAEDVGGGFGPKGVVYPEEILVAEATRRLQRPVRWVASRSEDGATTVQAHGTVLELELAASPQGKLRGLRGRLLHDVGAYATAGAGQPDLIVPHLLSAYVLPALQVAVDLVYTNTVPTGFIRGGGRPLGNFGMERMLDRLALRLNLDPTELRRRNLVQPDQFPYDTHFPAGRGTVVYDGGNYPKLLDLALEAIGYTRARERQAQQPAGGKLLGIGVACCVESSGWGRGEPARVRLEKDGRARLLIGSTPQGQGHQTMAAQMLAERLGWPLEKIQVTAGDTRVVPFAYFTAGSRSALHVGNAAALAGASARRRLLERAADVLEADPVDLVLDDGSISVRGAPGRTIPVTDAIPDEGLEVSESFEAQNPSAYSSGCHAALVEVDPETGSVDLIDYVIAHDTGRVINPLLLEGQLHGGFAHGLGMALFEEAVYQPEGSFVSASFLDYTIPGTPEVSATPQLRPHEAPTESNPERIKGVGESGTIPVPATIANAVEDALRRSHPEVTINRIPITPLYLFERLRGA